MKTGLTLSGGGAKGAYEAGVVKALAQCGVRIDAVSGASIGALNGAIVATAPTLAEAANRLEKLWRMLADEKIFQPNSSSYLSLLASAGAVLAVPPWVRMIAGFIAATGSEKSFRRLLGNSIKQFDDDGLFSNNPLREKLKSYVPAGALNKGLPLYVSLYKSSGRRDLLDIAAAMAGLSETPDSEYMLVQHLPEVDQHKALLASAALPEIFAAQNLNGFDYVDGGIGGWNAETGNTPVAPLIKAGCDIVIVAILTDGSFWDRRAHPGTVIIEIRPRTGIKRNGTMQDILAFRADHIEEWIDMGYRDAMTSMELVMGRLTRQHELSSSINHLMDELSLEQKSFEAMQRAMALLDEPITASTKDKIAGK